VWPCGNVSSSCDCVMPPLCHQRMSGRAGGNVRSSGRECPVERAGMSGRVGGNVWSSGWECPVRWADVLRVTAGMLGQQGSAPTGQPDRRTGRAKPVHGPSQPVRVAFAPGGRDICAHSTRHLRPVGGTSLTTRRDICTRWAGHLCPLDATFAPGGRGHRYPVDGEQRIRPQAATSRPAPRLGRPAARWPG
jgi:hypothetical protein